jgi:plasmid stabilization system protein ParE
VQFVAPGALSRAALDCIGGIRVEYSERSAADIQRITVCYARSSDPSTAEELRRAFKRGCGESRIQKKRGGARRPSNRSHTERLGLEFCRHRYAVVGDRGKIRPRR